MSGRATGFEFRSLDSKKNSVVHICNRWNEETLCGQVVTIQLRAPYRRVQRLAGDSHFHGTKMIETMLCKNCLKAAHDEIGTYRNRLYTSWNAQELRELLRPIPAKRPLPGRGALKPITQKLYNVRERLRRLSVSWFGHAMITQSGQSSIDETMVVVWDSGTHNAFMMGVNYAIDLVLTDFKLQKYNEWRDKAYTELHEFITGQTPEEIPEED